MPVNVDGRDAIDALIDWHLEKYAPLAPSRPLFPSRNKKGTVAVNRQSAHDMLKAAFMAAGLNGKIATHSLRKSFAQRVYEHSSDIYLVQELLGHKNVATTQKYIGVSYASARHAVEAIALMTEPDRNQYPGIRTAINGTKANRIVLASTSYQNENTGYTLQVCKRHHQAPPEQTL